MPRGQNGQQRQNNNNNVIGVNLVINQPLSNGHENSQVPCIRNSIGVFLLDDQGQTTIEQLRQSMINQLDNLPQLFHFLTNKGWPVNFKQEGLIRAHHVIDKENMVNIESGKNECRIGIMSTDSKPIGFIFANITTSLSQAREIINKQLQHKSKETFLFVDQNSWPVHLFQEDKLVIADVASNRMIHINYSQNDDNDTSSYGVHTRNIMDINYESHTHKHTKQMPFHHNPSKHLSRSNVSSEAQATDSTKEVLISYVRAEAALHALSLKEECEKQGFSVYLDVHEIKCGVDWQDSLNDAVSSCNVFVPLVTPRYGETQWTNREVKLADVLGKTIIPVNFLSDWPPACLGIQFATTQFIPWKNDCKTGKDRKIDISRWDKVYVVKVAEQIAELCNRPKSHSNNQIAAVSRESQLTRRVSMLRSYALELPSGTLAPLASQDDREGKPLIILSCHPQQNEIVKKLKILLEKEGYEVWSTSELITEHENKNGTRSAKTAHSRASKRNQAIEWNEKATKQMRIRFQRMADEACVVLFILSKAFALSLACQQQVYYCENRKKFVILKSEEFAMPGWMSMLIGTSTFEDIHRKGYKETLIKRIKRIISREADDQYNAVDITAKSRALREKLPKKNCVYISGGTKFYYRNSQAICEAIGSALAELDDIVLVTGGFVGVGDTIARSFYTRQMACQKEISVYHVLPCRDNQDWSWQGRQRKDKTFKEANFGYTVFFGDSVRERERIVSKAINICILVEGGPGAAHEAEQFCWNDHTVIPIKLTGGAAGGKFNVPSQIFEIPQNVSLDDWETLARESASAEDIGSAVARIVCSHFGPITADYKTIDDISSSPLSTASTIPLSFA